MIFDARPFKEYAVSHIPGVGEIKAAKDDGRLPMEDHHTRIVVFGRTPQQARAVAEAIAGEAFHNVSFFNVTFEEFTAAFRQ